jgi:peptide/nickel transport system substrate-binding protein
MPHLRKALALKTLVLLIACPLLSWSASARALEGIAMYGEPKHPPGFAYFPYVNPQAPKGGRLVLGELGTFDNLNPFTIKGVSPGGLRDYVYQSLLARSGDEPFSLYGLIAESVDVPADRSSITFHLRKEARFSDGAAITPEDVLFSFEVLRDAGWPYHRAHYAKVAKAEKLDATSVRFTFTSGGDREIPLIIGLMPILPRHRLNKETFERTTLEVPIGSGPYVVSHVDPGHSLTFHLNPEWWAKDLAVTRGLYNFAEIRIEYFRDAAALFEAFKAGEIDARPEEDPARWMEGYNIAAAAEGRLVKGEFDTGTPAGMSALAFNTRRPIFADQRVRRAFILLFDAEWINRSLYNGAYRRTQSFFERSYLSAFGRPADARERALLAPFAEVLKPEAVAGTLRMPEATGNGDNRANMQAAYKLLTEAGYVTHGGKLVKDGVPLQFEFLALTREQERLMLSYAETLRRLGIGVAVRQVDTAQYWSRLKNFDFDMIEWTWATSLSPGNEQLNRWSSQAAEVEGSLNYPGVHSPAVDAMLSALLQAGTVDDFTAAARALDRVLMSGDYVVPLFYLPKAWLAYWSHLHHPATAPIGGYDLDTWWFEPADRQPRT